MKKSGCYGKMYLVFRNGWRMMKREWFWRKELVDTGVLAELETIKKTKIPLELRDLIYYGNAGTPLKHSYTLNDKEYSFGMMLSFNRYEKETHIDTIFMALEEVKDETLLPFAIDEFSDYLCLELSSGSVVRYNHKTRDYVSANMGLNEFMNKLY